MIKKEMIAMLLAGGQGSTTCFRRRFAKKLSLSPAFCKKSEIHA